MLSEGLAVTTLTACQDEEIGCLVEMDEDLPAGFHIPFRNSSYFSPNDPVLSDVLN